MIDIWKLFITLLVEHLSLKLKKISLFLGENNYMNKIIFSLILNFIFLFPTYSFCIVALVDTSKYSFVTNVLASTDTTENIPEMFLKDAYIENADDGIGIYYYSYAFLPNSSKKIRTIVHSIEFDYESFNKVRIKIEYQNFFEDSVNTQLYDKNESWKTQFYKNSSCGNDLPFLSIYIKEAPAQIENLDIFAKITDISITRNDGNVIAINREINKIIFHPDSYYNVWTSPKDPEMRYRVFAGHNVLLFTPPDTAIYNMQFTLVDNYPNIMEGNVFSKIPLLFCTGSVEVRNCKVIWNDSVTSSISLFDPASLTHPLDIYVPGFHDSKSPRLKLSSSENEILLIQSLAGNFVRGSFVKELFPHKFSYEGICLTIFQNLLRLKKGLNVSSIKIDSPIPIAFYELLKKNSNVLVPPVMEYFIYNNNLDFINVKLTNQVLGISSPNIQNTRIDKNELKRLSFIPNFDHKTINSLLEPKEFTVLSRIYNGVSNILISEDTDVIKLLPYDTMIWQMIDESTGKTQTYYKYLVNWIRRFKSFKLDTLIKNTINMTYENMIAGYYWDGFQRARKNKIFSTEAEYSRHLVEALYNSLSNFKPRYMNETLDFGRSGSQFGQRIKYPQETLEQGRGNCIDSSILFAFLLECIGLNPVVVIVPGHAFIGWETWNNSGSFEYLETTMLGYYGFNDAYYYGMQEEKNSQSLDYNKVYHINIKKCREEGIFSFEKTADN